MVPEPELAAGPRREFQTDPSSNRYMESKIELSYPEESQRIEALASGGARLGRQLPHLSGHGDHRLSA